jgi:hypothetical protein
VSSRTARVVLRQRNLASNKQTNKQTSRERERERERAHAWAKESPILFGKISYLAKSTDFYKQVTNV